MSRSITSSLHAIYQKLVRTHSQRIQDHHRRKRKSRLSLERMESRQLMAGDVRGQIFHDTNDNSIQEVTEDGLAGWTVWVDTNSNGQQNVGEPSAVTDVKGKYLIAGIPAGNFNVIERLEPGFTPSTGRSDRQLVQIRDGKTAKADFPNITAPITTGSVSGTLFDDLNVNGVYDASDKGLPAWSVFVDLNNNGAFDADEPASVTDNDGDFSIADVPSGAHRIYEISQPGYRPVTGGIFPLQGAAPYRDVVVTSGGNVRVQIGNALNPVGTLGGNVWNDLNGDGVHQAEEVGIANRPIFIDLNANGLQDTDEPARLTSATGAYSFEDLRVGTHNLVEVLPTDFINAYGKSNSLFVSLTSSGRTVDFFNLQPRASQLSGKIFSDVNSDGKLTMPEPGIAGWNIFADLNNNGTQETSEPAAVTDVLGNYTLNNVPYGLAMIRTETRSGFSATSPAAQQTMVLSGENRQDFNFAKHDTSDFSLSGLAFHDANRNGLQDMGEAGLSGLTVFIDSNFNDQLDAGEVSTTTSVDKFYTPAVNEAGQYSFTHLANGTYRIVEVVSDELSGTAIINRSQTVTITNASVTDANFANNYRPSEIHGVVFDDTNNNHQWDAQEYARPNVAVYIDINRNGAKDDSEPETLTDTHGQYSFVNLATGAYIVREVESGLHGSHTYPITGGGTLWPEGTSKPAQGSVSHDNITLSLANGESYTQTVSLTLPGSGTITNLVDVFLLFDDTGSFTSNSPIVRSAFPTIIGSLQASLPGIDLGFGVGRFEEYGNFAAENSTGRPFILNQPIVASSTAGFQTAIQSALDRVAPGYGGDTPETDIEALYQLVTGLGFDGNSNGSVSDSGAAGLASTQVNPGISGDVPSFDSYVADIAHGGLPSAGNVGGGGFRAGALPVILLATDTGFAFQPKGETSITGTGGTSLPLTALTQQSRGTTPFGAGAGIQETVTGLNALGALVIGLGTNAVTTTDPRQALEALSTLTGAVNKSEASIPNGTPTPIAPGEPLYFQIGTGFGATVADGIVNAIQNAVTNVAMDITVRASDPRVKLINHTGTRTGIGAGATASFDIEFIGDGRPHRFDIQFVREGTDVVLGSIPVVMGTPVSGEGYSYDDLEDGEIHRSSHFGNYVANVAPSFTSSGDVTSSEDSGTNSYAAWATNISVGAATETKQSVQFLVSNDNEALFSVQPTISPTGTLEFTPAPNAFGTAVVTVQLKDNGGVGLGGQDTSETQTFTISIASINDAPVSVDDAYDVNAGSSLSVPAAGILSNDSDIDGDTLSAQLTTAPANGVVTLNSDGSFTYIPNVGFGGFDRFTYTATDSVSQSRVAEVVIHVTGLNTPAHANDDHFIVKEDQVLTVGVPGVLANDTDIEGDALTAVLLTYPQHGTIEWNTDGALTYVPNKDFAGVDSFQYKVFDGSLDSNVATVTIEVTPVNDAPVAKADAYELTEDSVLNIDPNGVLINDSDIDGDVLQASLVSGPSSGTLTLRADGSLSYRPAANFNGLDSFTYRVSDGLAFSNVVSVQLTVNSVNDAPTAVPDYYAVDENGSLRADAGVLSNDFDVDGDTLSVTLTTAAAHGTVSLNANGSFTYVPTPGYDGLDSFSYTVTDGTLSAVGTVSITVVPVVPPTKFYVADFNASQTFTYAENGEAISSYNLDRSTNKPRGIASNATGTLQWTVDTKGNVTVYDNTGSMLGTWLAQNLSKPEGITVSGNDLWIVDNGTDRVYKFTNGANVRSGRVAATSSFALNSANTSPMDLVTDGTRIWVLNDTVGNDRVFRYSTTGTLQGNWGLSVTNPSPTGITLDPNNVNHLWTVDSSTRKVYQYDGATALTTGTLEPSRAFALAPTNVNPQGIADPLFEMHARSKATQHNYIAPLDVNHDGQVNALDVQDLLSVLSHDDMTASLDSIFADVNDDSFVTPLDALIVVNAMNRQQNNPLAQNSSDKSLQWSSPLTGARVGISEVAGATSDSWEVLIDKAPAQQLLSIEIDGQVLGVATTDALGRGRLLISDLSTVADNQETLRRWRAGSSLSLRTNSGQLIADFRLQ